MGKSADPPAQVDYDKLIPLQTAANKEVFDYSLGASRVNTQTPYGSTTWSEQKGNPDQAAYEQALTAWKAKWPRISSGLEPRSVQTAADAAASMPKLGDFTKSQWTQTSSLSPEQQQLYTSDINSKLGLNNLTDDLTQDTADALGSPVDTSGLQGWNSGPAAGTQDRASELAKALGGYSSQMAGLDPRGYNQEAADAMYRQNTRYLDPQVREQQQNLEGRLAEQGFTPGTPAYNAEMDRMTRGNQTAYADARDRSTTLGATIGSQQFGNSMQSLQAQIVAALSGGQFGQNQDRQQFAQWQNVASMDNNLRNQQLAELLRLRANPLSELNAVRTGAQPVAANTALQQTSAPNLQAVDALGAAQAQYSNQMDAYNAQVGSNNATTGTLGQIAGAFASNPQLIAGLMAMSDRRLKRDIVHVGHTPAGVRVYEWTYLWGGGRYQGVMADEVPHAAVRHISGYWMVDYSKVG